MCRGHRSTWEFSCRAAEIIINSNYILENGEWVPLSRSNSKQYHHCFILNWTKASLNTTAAAPLSRSNKTIPTLFHPLTKQKRATIQRPLRRKKSIIIIRYPVTGERHGSIYSLTRKKRLFRGSRNNESSNTNHLKQ